MKLKRWILAVVITALLPFMFASCDSPFGQDGGQVHQRVDVKLNVRKPVPAALTNGLAASGTGQIGTSMIVAVADGTEPVARFELIAESDFVDRALLDLSTSSVSLSIPLGVSIQLFEYTFNDTLTLDSILADLPVAGEPNVSSAFLVGPDSFDEITGDVEINLLLSLQTTSIVEDFSSAPGSVNWERIDAGADVNGGVLTLRTVAGFDGSADATGNRFGTSNIMQTNRNLLLTDQRIAGRIRIDFFSTSDDPVAADAAQARAIAGLYYQPRSNRDTARTGLTGVRIMFRGRTGGTPVFVLNAFTCLNDTCASVADGDLEIAASLAYSFNFVGVPTADIPFELVYQGNGVFRGTFGGEVLTMDIPARGGAIFNENDFLYGRLQSQGMFMYDGSDTVTIAAVFDDIVVGSGAVAGIAITPTSGLLVSESGTSDTFGAVLTGAPDADVIIGLSSSDTGEATVSPTSLTFTPLNWDLPRSVTVTGVDDLLVDGDVAVTIVTAAAISADGTYDGMDASDVSVTVTDDDTAGISISTTTLTTSEAGGSASFTVVLALAPTANVVVAVTSSDATEGTIAPASLTFTTANWNVAQTVIVTGVNDFVDDGDIGYTISTSATSADILYNGLTGATVIVTNLDDDTAGITSTAITPNTTTEAGGSFTYTLVLNSEPLFDVTITVTSSDPAEFLVDGTPSFNYTFTALNWNIAQAVTITGVDDAAAIDGSISGTITDAATSSDALYIGISSSVPSIAVTNGDDDAIYVDAVIGLDANSGFSTAPLKTITFALGGAVSGDTVQVLPGLYDTTNGEAFPIVVPAGAFLIGDEANKGSTTTIDGAALASTVVDGALNSVIAGFNLTNGGGTFTFYPTASGVELRNSTVTGFGSAGIYIDGAVGGGHRIIGNVVNGGGTGIGLVTVGTPGALTLIQGNEFTNNNYGVEFDNLGGDLGGGATGSTGGNLLYCNIGNDFWSINAITVDAQNNFWDHVPPTTEAVETASGVDIFTGGSAILTTTGAMLAPSPCL